MKKFIKRIRNIIRTIKINLKLFPIKIAVKLPIKVLGPISKCDVRRGAIVIEGNIERFMIKLGVSGTDGLNDDRKNFLRIDEGGKLIVKGSTLLGEGISIRISKMGKLILGNNFKCNKNCFISCDDVMEFGDDVLIGWDVKIRDSDGHEICDLISNEKNKKIERVFVGNHVWIAANVHILKGTNIKDGSVVAYGSCVLSKFDEENCIIGGYPAKVLRKNIKWEE